MKASITFHGVAVALCVELFRSRPVLQTVPYVMCFLGGKHKKRAMYAIHIPKYKSFFIINQLKHGVTLWSLIITHNIIPVLHNFFSKNWKNVKDGHAVRWAGPFMCRVVLYLSNYSMFMM